MLNALGYILYIYYVTDMLNIRVRDYYIYIHIFTYHAVQLEQFDHF